LSQDTGQDTSGINAGKAPRVLLQDGTHQPTDYEGHTCEV